VCLKLKEYLRLYEGSVSKEGWLSYAITPFSFSVSL